MLTIRHDVATYWSGVAAFVYERARRSRSTNTTSAVIDRRYTYFTAAWISSRISRKP
jgi:hypothetical protein